MKVIEVHPDSSLYKKVSPGYRLVSINGTEVRDFIDYQYLLAEEQADICFTDEKGSERKFSFEYPSAMELGLTFEDDKTKRCGNKCVFCFIDQQPKGMRKALYVRDEDYRLSFTHGNYITLSNTTQDELDRIVEQRLSPLYVSVHTTDDELRKRMFCNKRLEPILPMLRYLADSGITIHTQIVLCPGINDGSHLDRTVNDLVQIYPSVSSLAVVPVGLTRYREKLPKLRRHTSLEAAELINTIETLQKQFLSALGSRFIWPADEFYVMAGRDFPRYNTYEEMAQFENGVGMVREFITGFNRRRSGLKGLKLGRTALFLTGASAWPFMNRTIMPYLKDKLGLSIAIQQVPNRFWGEMVSVSGLLTGQDLLDVAHERSGSYDIVVLPPNCLSSDDLFLDNLSLDQFRKLLGCEVQVGSYDMAATIMELCS